MRVYLGKDTGPLPGGWDSDYPMSIYAEGTTRQGWEVVARFGAGEDIPLRCMGHFARLGAAVRALVDDPTLREYVPSAGGRRALEREGA